MTDISNDTANTQRGRTHYPAAISALDSRGFLTLLRPNSLHERDADDVRRRGYPLPRER